MDKRQAEILLQRYRMGLCTPEEVLIVEKWLDKIVQERGDKFSENIGLTPKKEMWEAITKSMEEEYKVTRRRPLRTAIAAFAGYRGVAVLLMTVGLAISSYLLYNRQYRKGAAHTGPADHLAHVDIPPGANGAVLTLSSGEVVLLDSLGNTRIDSETSAELQNKDGVLYYGEAGESAQNEVVYNTISTPRARQYNLVLSDGTRLFLNSGSSVRYPTRFGTAAREVHITGEVYFEVTHQEAGGRSVPFIVHTDRTRIEVLGTEFNVNAYTDERFIETTLINGSVNVSTAGGEALLKPGKQARVDYSGRISVEDNVNLEQVTAWKSGLFSFENDDIQTVMRQLARWYDIEVSFGSDIPEETFWGDLQRNAPLSTVLRVLEKSGVKFSVDGKKVKVLKVTQHPKPGG